MGESKAALGWEGSTLLQRTVDVLGQRCDPVLVVAAPDQVLAVAGAEVLRDAVADQGPLQGLATGLARAAALGADTAFVCATDMPLLHPALVSAVLAARGPGAHPRPDVVMPVDDEHEHPLAAAYATALAVPAAELLAAGERRVRALGQRCLVRRITRTELLGDPALAAADPHLDSLVNVNTPAELAAVRQRHRPGDRRW